MLRLFGGVNAIENGPSAPFQLSSDGRVDVDYARLRAVFGGRKTFSHGLDPNRTFGGLSAGRFVGPIEIGVAA
jgi:hypothetical protein